MGHDWGQTRYWAVGAQSRNGQKFDYWGCIPRLNCSMHPISIAISERLNWLGKSSLNRIKILLAAKVNSIWYQGSNFGNIKMVMAKIEIISAKNTRRKTFLPRCTTTQPRILHCKLNIIFLRKSNFSWLVITPALPSLKHAGETISNPFWVMTSTFEI